MKSLKILGLAVVAAAALTAFVGPASALAAESGTTLCSVNETPCKAANHYATGTAVSASLSSAKATLAAGFATIECSKSTVGITTTSTGSATEEVKGNITSLTFGECNCEVTVLKNGTGSINHTTEMNGTLKAEGVEVEVVCPAATCFYGGTVTGIVVKGGAPATATATNTIITRLGGSNAACAKEAKWNATYTVSEPNPLWISGT